MGLCRKRQRPPCNGGLAETDKKFVWADAKIEGDAVVVSSLSVDKPTAVRYAWASNPDCNLYNKAALPASPFRSDERDLVSSC